MKDKVHSEKASFCKIKESGYRYPPMDILCEGKVHSEKASFCKIKELGYRYTPEDFLCEGQSTF